MKDEDILDYTLGLSIRSINICRKSGINTKPELLRYFKKHGHFFELCKNGKQTNKELTNACYIIDPLVKVKKQQDLVEKFGKCHLKTLIGLIKVRDYKFLLFEKSILTVEDFMNAEIEFDRQKNALKKNLEKAKTILEQNKNKFKALEFNTLTLVFEFFKFQLEPLHLSIVENRLLSYHNKTLQEISEEFNITRERVRQLEREIQKKFDNFLKGDVLGKFYLSKSCVQALRGTSTEIFCMEK